MKLNSNIYSEKDFQQQNSNENSESLENKNEKKNDNINNIPEKGGDLDFENCNVYLKNINPNNNRPYSRKRSAFKYIEDNMEREREKKYMKENFNSTTNMLKSINLNENNNNSKKPTKDNFKVGCDSNEAPNKTNLNNNQNSNKLNLNLNNFNNTANNSQKILMKDLENKPKIAENEKIGMIGFNEKIPEYESRRKKQINFMNGIDCYGNSNQVSSNNNNFQNFEIQKNKDSNKLNDNNNFNSTSNNLISSNFESRRLQGGYNKPVIIQAEKK